MELRAFHKQVAKSARRDRRQHMANMVSHDIDIRDQYMGLKNLRKTFTPIPLSMRDQNKKHIPMEQRAQKAAEFLGTQIWGTTTTEPAAGTDVSRRSAPAGGGAAQRVPQAGALRGTAAPPTQNNRNNPKPKLLTQNPGIADTPITIKEVMLTIAKLKYGKAPGPDGIPIECFKAMTETQLTPYLNMFNEWLDGTEIPEEVTQAQVILIHKKGDKTNLSNYRPISLLNAHYKIFTAILQARISEALDPYLQSTQYGFRKKKGTAQAIHYIRRIIEKGESTQTKTLLVLLHWDKAFDKVKHDKLFEALERMSIPDKTLKAIKQLYKNPTFRIEMEGRTSEWTKQKSGIRQGCPLSPTYS